MYVYVSMNLYIYIYNIYVCVCVCVCAHVCVCACVCVWIFCEQMRFYVLYVMPYFIVALCVIFTVQSSLLLLLHHRLYFLFTGMLSSRMLELVTVVAPMADIDLQNAPNYVQQMNQHSVKKACLMLCLTLDGWVC